MKLKESTLLIEKEGNFKDISFQISDNVNDQGLIFDILRSKMYSDPIESICREISSNSRDANREVGKGNVPIVIEIKYPNSLLNVSDICISFKDEGPGISPDRMINIYSKYAASTKRNTNSLTGGFGLGAKTPMAYSDSFWVITNYEGIKYNYLCYIDDTRKGKISEISQEVSDETNGTEILIPIKEKDVNKFEAAIVKATFFWDIPPILKNLKSFYFKNFSSYKNFDKKDFYENENFIIVKKDIQPFLKDYNLIIDGIHYPIKSDLFNQNIPDLNIIFKIPNGLVNISSNRETLQYDEETIEILKEKYNLFNKFCLSFLRKSLYNEKKENKKKYLETLFNLQNKYSPNSILKSLYNFISKKTSLSLFKDYQEELGFKYHKIQLVSIDDDRAKVEILPTKINKLLHHEVYYSSEGRQLKFDKTIRLNTKRNSYILITPINFQEFKKIREPFQLLRNLNSKYFKKPFCYDEVKYKLKLSSEKNNLKNSLSFLDIKDYSTLTPFKSEKEIKEKELHSLKINFLIKDIGYYKKEVKILKEVSKVELNSLNKEMGKLLGIKKYVYFYQKNLSKSEIKENIPSELISFLFIKKNYSKEKIEISLFNEKDKKYFDFQYWEEIKEDELKNSYEDFRRKILNKKYFLKEDTLVKFLKKNSLISEGSTCYKYFKNIFEQEDDFYKNLEYYHFEKFMKIDDLLYEISFVGTLFVEKLRTNFILLNQILKNERCPKNTLLDEMIKYSLLMKKENDNFNYDNLFEEFKRNKKI